MVAATDATEIFFPFNVRQSWRVVLPPTGALPVRLQADKFCRVDERKLVTTVHADSCAISRRPTDGSGMSGAALRVRDHALVGLRLDGGCWPWLT